MINFSTRYWEGPQKLRFALFLLMVEVLHYLKDPKPWELWYIPYYW